MMSSVSSILFLVVIALFAVGFIWLAFNRAKIKGKMGEFEVSAILATLSGIDYIVINNITLPSKFGTTQIDHIVVSIYGIFVIETKNYTGLIYGGENAETWTKNMWGNKYEYRNPHKQNYGHVKTLQQLLNLPMGNFIPIVVFSNSANISVQTDKTVITLFHLRGAITRHKTVMFTLRLHLYAIKAVGLGTIEVDTAITINFFKIAQINRVNADKHEHQFEDVKVLNRMSLAGIVE